MNARPNQARSFSTSQNGSMNQITTKGTVFTGSGIGSLYIKIPWVQKQIRAKLGFSPYFGTLNIRLQDQQEKQLENLRKRFKGIEISPAPSFFPARCFTASIMNTVKGAVIIPEKPNYPSDVLEIIAPDHLREKLRLKDGDEVEITIFLKIEH